ncbi:MAG TPA: Ig-like domain-containing protein, partial [Thermoanaerobaculia bacterium]|nr:Ig-like domain-containing protein [Thermoanaerobaculia bacterium]
MSRRFAAVVVAVLSLSTAAVQAAPRLAGVIPVAGSTAGANAAHFRTALQLNNGTASRITGSIVFHPAGRPGSAADPSVAYALEPRQTISWGDVVASTGATGLGSLDLFTDGDATPSAVARAYDDGGAAGTKGVTVPLLRLSDAATKGQLLTLIAPANTERSRFNIGIRTLAAGARFRFLVFSADGSTRVVGNEETFAADYFEQRGAAAFANAPIGPNDSVGILVLQGSVLAYGTMTDNRTNDPSIQLAEQHNSVPIALPATVRIGENADSAGIVLQAVDDEGEVLLFSIASQPAHGTLSALQRVDAHDVSLAFTAGATFAGTDSFVFHVEDENGGSSEATIKIIRSNSQPPTADNTAATTLRDQPVTITLHGTNPEGGPLGFTFIVSPAHGTLGTITMTSLTSATTLYTPAAGYTGTDFFLFAANDDHGGSATARVDITVTAPSAQNRAPAGSSDAYTTDEDTPLTIAAPGVLSNDTDPDGDALTATLVATPAHGTVTLQANGSFTYSPSPDFSGYDSFTYRVTDGQAVSADVTVNLTINAVNDPPSFLLASNTATVLEDSGAATVASFVNGVDAGGNEPGQVIHFNVATTNPALFTVQP